jgi:hypothetical protein
MVELNEKLAEVELVDFGGVAAKVVCGRMLRRAAATSTPSTSASAPTRTIRAKDVEDIGFSLVRRHRPTAPVGAPDGVPLSTSAAWVV